MSTNGRNGRVRAERQDDARARLESELDPGRGRRTLAAGVLVFRIATLAWMVGSNLIADGFARPALAFASLSVAALWTLWLGLRPRDQGRTWALIVDLSVSTGLILVSAYVVPPGDVISPTRLFFATAYPISTPLMWGMSRGVWGGLGSALVLAVALGLTRPLNGVTYDQLSQFVAVINGSVYYFAAGGTMGAIAKSLDRSAGSVRRAVNVAMTEQERARWADTARELHDSVLQGLGYLKRRLRDAADASRSDRELSALAEFTAHQEQDLRDWINREHRSAPPGYADLGSRLKETRRRVQGLEVTVNSVGEIRVPERVAAELCAAVQQALENVARHANTTRAFVFVEVERGWLLTSVSDEGSGFVYDPERLRELGRLGMEQSMRGRVEQLGGRMTVDSAPGSGTTVEFRVPVDPTWAETASRLSRATPAHHA